jgi:hypothetical protein
MIGLTKTPIELGRAHRSACADLASSVVAGKQSSKRMH